MQTVLCRSNEYVNKGCPNYSEFEITQTATVYKAKLYQVLNHLLNVLTQLYAK
jgi:hypothetical protein